MALVRKSVVKRSNLRVVRKVKEGMTLTGGFWFPAWDERCRRFIFKEEIKFQYGLSHCKAYRVAVQAGGNVGVWPCYLADRFTKVYTFEPDALNFECLAVNTRNHANVTAYQAGLGQEGGRMGINRCFYKNEGNCGGNFTVSHGPIPMTTIDSLNLLVCDFIQLDIEGFEPAALTGAARTIRRCRPVVQFEEKGHGARYGYQRGTAGAFLETLGMSKIGEVEADHYYGWPTEPLHYSGA